MTSDVETFLARIGQPKFDYVSFNTPTDLDVAKRLPLLAQLVTKLAHAPSREAAAS